MRTIVRGTQARTPIAELTSQPQADEAEPASPPLPAEWLKPVVEHPVGPGANEWWTDNWHIKATPEAASLAITGAMQRPEGANRLKVPLHLSLRDHTTGRSLAVIIVPDAVEKAAEAESHDVSQGDAAQSVVSGAPTDTEPTLDTGEAEDEEA